MPPTLEDLHARAMRLTPAERAELADRLWASVVSEADVSAAWAAEIERRVAQLEAAEVQTALHDDAVARMRPQLG